MADTPKAYVAHFETDLHKETESMPTDTGNDEATERLTWRTLLVVLATVLAYFAQLYSLVGPGALSRDIAGSIGGSSQRSWLSEAILIMTAVCGPPAAGASDVFGRRYFVVAGATLGFVGSLITGKASSMPIAIAGQVITGAGFASQPLLHSIPSEVMPRRWRPLAQGAINMSAGLAAIVALMAGGRFVEKNTGGDGGWRWFFYLAAILYGISTAIMAFLYRPPPPPHCQGLTTEEKWSLLDPVGYALLATGLVPFVVGLNFAQNPYPWASVQVLAPLCIGSVALVLLALYATFVRRDGFIHQDLFSKDRNCALCVVGMFVEGLVFFALNQYYPFQLSVLYESQPFKVLARYTIFFGVSFAVVPLVSIYTSVTRRHRDPIVLGYVVLVIFTVVMSQAGLDSSTAVTGYVVLAGAGFAAPLVMLISLAQLGTPSRLIATSTSLLVSARSVGGVVGTAIYLVVFNNKMAVLPSNIAQAAITAGLHPSSAPAFVGALAGQHPELLGGIPGVTPAIIGAGVLALKLSFLNAFKYVWYSAIPFTVLAVIVSALLVEEKQEMTMGIDAPVDAPAKCTPDGAVA